MTQEDSRTREDSLCTFIPATNIINFIFMLGSVIVAQ